MNDEHVLYRIPDSGPPITRARLATVLWIVAETMIFAALLSGFVITRMTSPMWPPTYEMGGLVMQPPRVLKDLPGVNAGIILSAFIMALRAQQAARRGDLRRCRARLTTVTVLGILFVAIVVWEFVIEAGRGVTIGSGTYGTYWASLTAAHALHVLVGVVWLFIVLTRGITLPAGGVDRHAVEHIGLYWGFVTVVWIILLVMLHVF